MHAAKLAPRLQIVLLMVFFASAGFAQSRRAFERAGDKAFTAKDYNSAFAHFSQALEKAPKNKDLQWKFAETARILQAIPIAEKSYQSLLEEEESNAKFPLVIARIAEIQQQKGEYSKAIQSYESFLSNPGKSSAAEVENAQQNLLSCQWAIAHLTEKKGVTISHPDKKINSPYSDFAPVLRGDTLFFSSYRFEKIDRKHNIRRRMTRLMMSSNGKAAREPLRGIPAGDSAHVAHTAFTPDGKFLIFNYCKNINPYDIRCELWLITQDRKGRWTKPRKLPEPVNIAGYTSTQPSIGLDARTGNPRLWFSSDRPGGKGGLDIWSVPLDPDWFCPCNLPLMARKPQPLPSFATPKPVQSINTPGNDGTPFYSSLDTSLYFSSDARAGFGGYDIYRSKDKKEGFSEPENLGLPINSSYNDVYYFQANDGLSAWLSSNRLGSYYIDERNKSCCNDLFKVNFEPPATTKDTTLLVAKTPLIPVPQNVPVKALPPLQFSDFKGLPLYFDNDEPDKKTRKTSTKQSYEESVLRYLERQDDYRQRRAEGLDTEGAGNAEAEVDNFFDNEVRSGYDRLSQLCDLMLARLSDGAALEIQIRGFTSPRAQSDYNLNLGKRRISSVRNQLSEWSEGALKMYLDSGQLKITELSFGETVAKKGLSDDLRDERNSIYAPDAARERRVEIVEIKTIN